MHRSPAAHVIAQFGGVRKTAKALGMSPQGVSAWSREKARGGGGGDVPGSQMRHILALASELKLDITAQDLILGREVSAEPEVPGYGDDE